MLRIRLATGPAGSRAAFLVLALAASAASVQGQEIEPRAFSNIPIGVHFLIAGYGYAEGGLVTNPALPVDRHHSVKLYASTGVSTRIGTDSDTIGIAWQYRWGGGL